MATAGSHPQQPRDEELRLPLRYPHRHPPQQLAKAVSEGVPKNKINKRPHGIEQSNIHRIPHMYPLSNQGEQWRTSCHGLAGIHACRAISAVMQKQN